MNVLLVGGYFLVVSFRCLTRVKFIQHVFSQHQGNVTCVHGKAVDEHALLNTLPFTVFKPPI